MTEGFNELSGHALKAALGTPVGLDARIPGTDASASAYFTSLASGRSNTQSITPAATNAPAAILT